MVTPEEWVEWKRMPATQEFVGNLRGDVAAISENWGAGTFTGASMAATLQKNAEAIGNVSALNKVIEFIENLKVEDAEAPAGTQ